MRDFLSGQSDKTRAILTDCPCFSGSTGEKDPFKTYISLCECAQMVILILLLIGLAVSATDGLISTVGGLGTLGLLALSILGGACVFLANKHIKDDIKLYRFQKAFRGCAIAVAVCGGITAIYGIVHVGTKHTDRVWETFEYGGYDIPIRERVTTWYELPLLWIGIAIIVIGLIWFGISAAAYKPGSKVVEAATLKKRNRRSLQILHALRLKS